MVVVVPAKCSCCNGGARSGLLLVSTATTKKFIDHLEEILQAYIDKREQEEAAKVKAAGRTGGATRGPLPEKPDTKDETVLQNWRWHTRSVKKANGERNSQRCVMLN